jgi:Domain of unknown function (DUF4091)
MRLRPPGVLWFLPVVVTAVVTATVATAARSGASDASVRALLLTQRFTHSSAPPSNPLASRMVALRGETEGFQLAVRAPGTRLYARLAPDSDGFLAGHVRLLQVGFVEIRRTSTGAGHGAGLYADPLPRLTEAGMATEPGRWAGIVVLASVPSNAEPGTYSGAIEVRQDGDRVVATAPFSIRVSAVRAIAPPDPRAFRVVAGVSSGWYSRLAGAGTGRGAESLRARQRNALLAFLAAHYVSPVDWPAISPSAGPSGNWTAKFLPIRKPGFNMRRSWQSGGAEFIRQTAATWRARGWADGVSTYFYSWDEPGWRTQRSALPAIDRLVHQNAPGVKTFATAYPYLRRTRRRICARFDRLRCGYTRAAQARSNRALWNGGGDDVDAWAVATWRYYGEWSTPLEHRVGINHALDTWRILRALRRAGKEVWSYTYFMPTRKLPQLVVDGTPTDPRLLMLWNGYEHNTGWLVWQLMRWIAPTASDVGRGPLRNPYEQPLSTINPAGSVANGDVSLFYPPVAPQYGLTDPAGEPVTSLRLESLRDGVEDVNLLTLYREKRGAAAARRALASVLGPVRQSRGVGWTWVGYRTAGLATRMELARRRLIAALEPSASA